MIKLFDVVFLDEAFLFLKNLNNKSREKILFNIRKAQSRQDPELFKKLRDDIWEFRTLHQGIQYRMFAFWDKTNSGNTVVVATHGLIKKRNRVPENEIQRAKQLRITYFAEKE